MAGLVQASQYFLRPMDARVGITAVQRPTMRFVATKTAGQSDLRALHRVRARLLSERTATVNEIRAFLLDRGIAAAQGIQRLHKALPDVLAKYTRLLSPRMIRIIDITCTLSRRG
jgi:transposase